MGTRVHIQTKHEIEYGSEYFSSNCKGALYDWLTEFGVDIVGAGDYADGDEWELDKKQLRALKNRGDEAFSRDEALPFVGDCEDLEAGIDRAIDKLKSFVDDCLAAPTGKTAYMSWW